MTKYHFDLSCLAKHAALMSANWMAESRTNRTGVKHVVETVLTPDSPLYAGYHLVRREVV
jgi:hypothetical protein